MKCHCCGNTSEKWWGEKGFPFIWVCDACFKSPPIGRELDLLVEKIEEPAEGERPRPYATSWAVTYCIHRLPSHSACPECEAEFKGARVTDAQSKKEFQPRRRGRSDSQGRRGGEAGHESRGNVT